MFKVKAVTILLFFVSSFWLLAQNKDVYNFKEINVTGRDKSIVPIGKKEVRLLDLGEYEARKKTLELPPKYLETSLKTKKMKKESTSDKAFQLHSSYFSIMAATHGRYNIKMKDTFNTKYSDKLHYLFYGERSRSDGYRPNGGSALLHLGLEVNNQFEEDGKLSGNVEYNRKITHLPGPTSAPTPDAKNDDQGGGISADYSLKLSPIETLEIKGNYYGKKRYTEIPLHSEYQYLDNDFIKLAAEYNRVIGKNSLLTLGYNLLWEDLDANNFKTDEGLGGYDSLINYVYAKRDIELNENSILMLELGFLNDDYFSTYILPGFEFKYLFSDRLSFDLSFKKDYERRDFSNLFMQKIYVPFEDNIPFREQDYTLGILGMDYQMSEDYSMYFKMYKKNYNNYHYYDEVYGTDKFNLNYTNGSVDMFGINLGGTFAFSEQFKGEVKYNFLLTDYKDKDLPNIPRNRFDIKLKYDWMPGLKLTLDEKIVGQYYTDISNTKKISSTILMNLRADYNLNDSIKAYVGIDNLFDKDYSLRYEHPGEGRVFYTGLDFQF
jgi:outer membrane receptor protein involved in Fe transport